jgi:hypothetical protein
MCAGPRVEQSLRLLAHRLMCEPMKQNNSNEN